METSRNPSSTDAQASVIVEASDDSHLSANGEVLSSRDTIGNEVTTERSGTFPPISPNGPYELECRPYVPPPDHIRQGHLTSVVGGSQALANEEASPEDWRRKEITTPSDSRRLATRKIKLVQGSVLSINHPVPSAIYNAVGAKYKAEHHEEFSQMRYTAATCDPNEFTLRNGYNLRPGEFNRHTELIIAVTYYNEDKFLLARTLHSIMQNARDILHVKNSKFWNKGGPHWQKLLVCVLMDGIDSCDRGVLDVLATIGVYQDGVMKKDIDGKETVAHIFEYTTQLSVTSNQYLVRPDETHMSFPPVQMMVCLKQKNSKKINSHRWLYYAFGRILNPEIVISLDAGTKPLPKALFNLWKSFYNDKNLGGCCGEIYPMLGKRSRNLLKPLVAAQNFEYKISCILDKPMETAFGYVTVLPGAFSAYRFRAIMGRPLEKYFHGDPTLSEVLGKKGLVGMNAFVRNMFLAEDRILSFELVMKANRKWHTRYVKEAIAETDIPEGMVEFITQRRRWLNGTFAATIYSLLHFWKVFKTGHNIVRIGLLHFQLLYNIVSLLLSWFGIAGFLLTTFILTDLASSPSSNPDIRPFPFGKATPIFNAVVQTIYLCTTVLQVIMSMGNTAKSQFWGYLTSFLIFGVIQFYFILNVIYLIIRIFKSGVLDGTGSDYNYVQTFYTSVGNWTVLVTCGSVFGVYYAASFLALDPWHMFNSYPQYLFVASSYTNILNIYAFSNWHDVTWGEKPGKERKIADALPSAVVKTVSTSSSQLPVLVSDEVKLTQDEIDERFEATVKRALAPFVIAKANDKELSVEELFRAERTRLLAVYLFSNFLLCLLIMNDSFDSLKFLGDSFSHKIWFFKIWMWGTSATFVIRFVGSCYFHLNTFVHWILYFRSH